MFTAAEYRLIRGGCLSDLQKLLAMLNISEPNWNGGDEFRIYEKVDDEIINRVCRLMKSESIIDGYTKFMKFGNLHFDYSETDNELLATILKNKNSVMHGATQAVQSTQEKVVETKPQKITKTVEKKIFLPGFIVVGVMFIIVAVVLMIQDLTIGAVIAGVLGLISSAFGINGKTVKENVEVNGAPVQKQTNSVIQKAEFTNAEIQKVFEVLSQIHKIICSI